MVRTIMSISRAKRWRVQYPVQVVSQDFADEARTLDVSLRGLSLMTTQSVRPGTQVYVRLLLPGLQASVDYEVCTVQWAADGKIGLETSEMRTTEEQRLHRHLSSLHAYSYKPVPDETSAFALDQPIHKVSEAVTVLWHFVFKPLMVSPLRKPVGHRGSLSHLPNNR
jgi:PilZ domain